MKCLPPSYSTSTERPRLPQSLVAQPSVVGRSGAGNGKRKKNSEMSQSQSFRLSRSSASSLLDNASLSLFNPSSLMKTTTSCNSFSYWTDHA